MEIGIAILLFVCMTALLYVLLSLKISRQVDLQIKEFYKTRIHADMQEFYREMEGYAALFENRIQRFRVLVERNEAVLRDAEAPRPEVVPEPAVSVAPEAPVATRRDKKNDKKAAAKAKPHVKAKAVASKKPTTPVVQAKPAPKPSVVREVPQPQVAPRRAVEVMPAAEIRRPMAEVYPDGDDSAIAEELMKDLFLKDEVELSQKKTAAPVASAPAPVPERAESPGMANFFSRLGKAIEPVLFGEKPAPQGTAAKPELTRTAPPVVGPAKAASDFSEVLRRAEQIKAEKQAERERAEVEAKAEFYAAGDSFQNLKTANEPRARHAVQAESPAARMQPLAEPQTQRAPMAVAEAPRRNNLVVKELDRHTVNFLIDSLVKDNGYRKQALRALTENNIPLDEIARLSKIDIGELELMRQLGRF